MKTERLEAIYFDEPEFVKWVIASLDDKQMEALQLDTAALLLGQYKDMESGWLVKVDGLIK